MKKLKTQAKSWKNSSKIRKKLKNRQLQLSSDGGIFFTNPKVFPIFAHVVNFWNCKFESTLEILHSQCFFTHNTEAHGAKFYRFNSLDLLKKLKELLVKKLKTQGKTRKNSRQNPKKLKNRQLQLSWVAKKTSKNKPWINVNSLRNFSDKSPCLIIECKSCACVFLQINCLSSKK